MELFEYWEIDPQLHLMVKSYLGIETHPKVDAIETAQAIKIMGGGRRAPKLATASEIDRERFEITKKMAKEKKRGR